MRAFQDLMVIIESDISREVLRQKIRDWWSLNTDTLTVRRFEGGRQQVSFSEKEFDRMVMASMYQQLGNELSKGKHTECQVLVPRNTLGWEPTEYVAKLTVLRP